MTRQWFLGNWMYAGFVAGLFLCAVLPVFAGEIGLALVLVYLQLPVYMLHQLEEHTDDRFRRYVNNLLAGGRDALTTLAVVVINVGGVWAVNLVVLWLACFVELGLGLIAVYLTLVNAVVHMVAAAVKRQYNPGLVTAVALFVPVGLYSLSVLSREPGVTAGDHALAIAFAVLLHGAIVVHVKRRAAALASAPA